MDYVVFGIGMGASLVLVGLAGRTIGPSLRYRTSRNNGEVLKAEQLVARVAWARFCSSLGAALALGGFFLLLVTAALMALRPSDGTATAVVIAALVIVLGLMILWTWAFVNRFGLYGIVVARERAAQPAYSGNDETFGPAVPEARTSAPAATAIAKPAPTQPVQQPQPTVQPPDQEPSRPQQQAPATEPTKPVTTQSSPRTSPEPARPAPVNETRPQQQTAEPTPATPPVTATATEQKPKSEGDKAVPTSPPATEPKPKRTFKPWSTPAVDTITDDDDLSEPEQQSRPATDHSRSEVINPSDAAALDRILSEPDSTGGRSAEEILNNPGSPDEQNTSSNNDPPIPAAPWNRRKHQRR